MQDDRAARLAGVVRRRRVGRATLGRAFVNDDDFAAFLLRRRSGRLALFPATGVGTLALGGRPFLALAGGSTTLAHRSRSRLFAARTLTAALGIILAGGSRRHLFLAAAGTRLPGTLPGGTLPRSLAWSLAALAARPLFASGGRPLRFTRALPSLATTGALRTLASTFGRGRFHAFAALRAAPHFLLTARLLWSATWGTLSLTPALALATRGTLSAALPSTACSGAGLLLLAATRGAGLGPCHRQDQ